MSTEKKIIKKLLRRLEETHAELWYARRWAKAWKKAAKRWRWACHHEWYVSGAFQNIMRLRTDIAKEVDEARYWACKMKQNSDNWRKLYFELLHNHITAKAEEKHGD